MSMDQEEGDVKFATTFCVIGVASSVYRSVSSVVNACAITSFVFLSMYLHLLLSNTTLQWGSHADCPTERSVTLSSGT